MSTVTVELKQKTHSICDIYQAWVKDFLKKYEGTDTLVWTRYNRNRSIKNFWVYQKLSSGKIIEVMTYDRFKEIITEYFKVARRQIIYEGEGLHLGHHLGIIAARRVEKNHAKGKKFPNWKATMANPPNPETSKRKMVYYTDDYYCRIGWERTHMLSNQTAYQFVPTKANDGGPIGFKGEFTAALQADPSLEFKYRFFKRR